MGGAGSAVAAQSSATGEGLSSLSTVAANSFLVQLRDSFGNALASAGDTVTYSVAGPSTAVKQAVVYAGAGAYSTSYTVSGLGAYTVTVSVNGAQLPGSPFTATASTGKLALASGLATLVRTRRQAGRDRPPSEWTSPGFKPLRRNPSH